MSHPKVMFPRRKQLDGVVAVIHTERERMGRRLLVCSCLLHNNGSGVDEDGTGCTRCVVETGWFFLFFLSCLAAQSVGSFGAIASVVLFSVVCVCVCRSLVLQFLED